MNKDEEIRMLAARFMAGETSLDEERRLYRYFSGNEVAADLLPMREFFCSLSAMMPLEKPETERKRQPVRLLSRQTFIGIAARWPCYWQWEACCGAPNGRTIARLISIIGT